MTVINESCEKEHSRLEDKLEALLVEQKMMKLTERKAKEDLEELNNDLLELRKQDLEVNEKLLEQRADTESKREVYSAQLRCLKDELVTMDYSPTHPPPPFTPYKINDIDTSRVDY